MSNQPLVLPFSAINKNDLPIVGGKGANLGEMTQAGFPVPSGFSVTTAAFETFMTESGQAEDLYRALFTIELNDLEAARQIGQQVRDILGTVPVPNDIQTAVLTAYQAQGTDKAYAVRSSATAEDLPDASFAGQQDTYLNVKGADELITAVRNCWISLFTDRAILYRIQNGFDHRQVSLSVVVQEMVLPDISGIMFTADPLTGDRDSTTIDASYGLGEALVAGLVSADLYKVNRRNYTVTDIKIADKQLAVRPLPDGGTVEEPITGEARSAQVLTEAQAIILAEIGQRITQHYGQPQDIEWALTNGKFTILQSRPITSLFPVPEKAVTHQKETGHVQVMFSFASVQGVMEPITPLGVDTGRTLFANGGRLFGFNKDIHTQNAIWDSGERLWVNFTVLARHPIGKKIMRAFLHFIDPEAAEAMGKLMDESDFQAGPGWFKLSTIQRFRRFLQPIIQRTIAAMRHPDTQRTAVYKEIEAYVKQIESESNRHQTLSEQLSFFYGADGVTGRAMATILPQLLPLVAGGMASLNLLRLLTKDLPPDAPSYLTLTRGLPYNVTTEMDLALWHTAQAIKQDVAATAVFTQTSPTDLSAQYLAGQLPTAAQTAVSQFMAQYGIRGLGEIDIGRPRWRENPTHIMQVLQSYLQIDNPALAPDAVFARGEAEAEAAVAALTTAVLPTKFGTIKARLVPFAAQRMRTLVGARETPKFTIIRIFGMVREGLLKSGEQLVAQGIIQQPDDLFYLYLDELYALAAGEQRDWQQLVADRRAKREREMGRKRIPRLLLSDGRAFYEGGRIETAVAEANTIVGSPVSPGIVEGVAHVVFNPHESQLEPGEILVCPGTDPAWTPLFLAAGGLITEVGGLMTHGSVVAREYGIPAVVGVNHATTQIKTGQKIRVDGSQGTITLL